MEEAEIFDRNTKPRLDSHMRATAEAEAAGLFTDDLILEILSRLPARSLHRFKCVSVAWRDLITAPANRKKLPQTLAGFLYMATYNNVHRHHFASVSGGAAPFHPCLPYLQPNKYKGVTLVDACNGLLLYCGYDIKDDSHLVVCNPATGSWVELPPKPQAPANIYSGTALSPGLSRLAFDPAVSSHFHVLSFEEASMEPHLTGVSIYSSRTRAWNHRDSGIAEKVILFFFTKSVFVGGLLYLMGNLDHICSKYVLLGVDMEGKVWKIIHLPCGQRFGTIGLLQGCLHYAIASADDDYNIIDSEISLWCLKDRDSKELVLKHTASIDKLMSTTGLDYRVVVIHPDCHTIFLISHRGDTLVAYDMRHQKVGRTINLEGEHAHWQRFLPHVPLFSESLADADEQ